MQKRQKKAYVAAVVRCPRIPKEDIRIQKEMTDVLYRSKMESLQKQAMQKQQVENEVK